MRQHKFNNKHIVCISDWDYSDLQDKIETIKGLRKNYKGFPYLYEYDENEENRYLSHYLTNDSHTDCWVAKHNNKIVGVSLGCPLSKEFSICSDVAELTDSESAYYFGDIIIDKNYEGYGIASKLYDRHIHQVKMLGYKKICALIVERDNNDPRKPSSYKKPGLWEKFNFMPTKVTTSYDWNTIQQDGSSKNESNIMRLYEKIM